MEKGEMNMLRGKTAKMAAAALFALSVLSFTACGDTADAAKAFFDSEYRLVIVGNWRDAYGDDPKPLLKELMEHGISGGLDGQVGGPVYTFDAGTGETLFHPAQGY